jgi:[acyl-carrier-protein] S-malonyltransferase
MGAPWTETPSWSVVTRLSDVLGRDLGALLIDADGPTLQETRNAQAATFALSLVVLDHVASRGLHPEVVAGHSLGEYTALVAAGALDEDAGMALVGARGDAMQVASDANPGTMAAVLGLDPPDVAAACEDAPGQVWVANDNAPGQVVIAGTLTGVEVGGAAAKARGAKRVMPLAVGGAFHSPLMAPAQDSLDAALRATAFGDAKVPVIANVDAEAHTCSDEWAAQLSAQLCQAVRWRESLEALAAMGVTSILELGPGDALTGMAKRTIEGIDARAVGTPDAAATVGS